MYCKSDLAIKTPSINFGRQLATELSVIPSSPGKLLGVLGQGDHFGEMSVLADIPRQATVMTKTCCLLISISRAHFRNLMKVVPDVGESVQAVMRLYMLSKFFHSLLYSQVLKNLVIGALVIFEQYFS